MDSTRNRSAVLAQSLRASLAELRIRTKRGICRCFECAREREALSSIESVVEELERVAGHIAPVPADGNWRLTFAITPEGAAALVDDAVDAVLDS